jgi:hypothetical protein
MRLSVFALGVCVLLSIPGPASAQAPDAWWTGPMLANSAATLPRGHVLLEPYFYDVASAHANGYGSRSYLLYGASNRLTIGLIPVLGFTAAAASPGVSFGDLTLIAQYGLTRSREGHHMPATALMIQETMPTGKYDRLNGRPGDGVGGGSYTTTVGLNLQTYVRAPTGRVLRMRVNVSGTMSNGARVDGVSVFGTPEGFHGTAAPGAAFFADTSFEYSLTRRVAVATDVFCSGNGRTQVTGWPSVNGSSSSHAVGVAPAVELSFTQSLGVLLGVRIIPSGGHTARSITPAVAINFVH